MKLALAGLNHRTAPVEVRERLAFDANSVPAALTQLKGQPGLVEGLILSTCNRVEVVVTAADHSDPAAAIVNFLCEVRQIPSQTLRLHLYHYEQSDAIRHLFRVASSLDSMVLGEPQILGQLKAAYAMAKAEGSVNGYLDSVLTRAFAVAKRVRTETEIGQNAVSVSYAAVELARTIFGSLQGRKVMIAGAGKMSVSAARHLRRAGAEQIYVTNRTRQRAVQLANEFGGAVIEYAHFHATLPEVDILITSSAAPHYILMRDDMRRVMGSRRHRPMFLIDIAVPRNIEPEVNTLDNVFLYDIDDLEKAVEANRQARQKEALQAEDIIDEEVGRLLERLRLREAGPAILWLQESLEAIRRSELERLRGKFGGLTPQQEEALEMLTRGLLNKFAHGPIREIRRQAQAPGGADAMDLVHRMFRPGGAAD